MKLRYLLLGGFLFLAMGGAFNGSSSQAKIVMSIVLFAITMKLVLGKKKEPRRRPTPRFTDDVVETYHIRKIKYTRKK